MRSSTALLAIAACLVDAVAVDKRQASSSSSSVPQYFITTPDLFAGPTPTGTAPFLAATNPAPFGAESSFVALVGPLETAIPIAGNTNNTSIFQYMGQLSPYFPNPSGFGANEYPLPPGANITLISMLARHGSRYPTSNSSVQSFGQKIHALTSNGSAQFTGSLSFLNSYSYNFGAEVLVPQGHRELFDNGVRYYYNYGRLYNTSTKIIARTTSENRMLKSAEYFLAGFFGLEWTNNATLEVMIEGTPEYAPTLNNTLAGYDNCNNSNNYLSTGGANASTAWSNIYLQDATKRFKALSGKYNWTVADSYNAQSMCPYETVAYGYSSFCDLFTFDEWKGYEYSVDLSFMGNDMFASPTGRAVGIGYVEELYARLQGHVYNLPPGSTQVNTTLDEMNSTFPTNQTLYFDFSHDTNIASIITAFGLTQFNQTLPMTGPPANQQMIVSHMEPFGANMVFEIIKTPQPLKATRPANSTTATTSDYYNSGNATSYVHLLLNQRTIPLGRSYAACGQRDDGWCEMSTFLTQLGGLLTTARYDYSCNANYSVQSYGKITNGVPISKRALSGSFGSGLTMKRSSDM